MRTGVLVVCLGILVVFSTLVGSSAGATLQTVRVVFQPFQSYGALFIADREGYFAAEGIKVDWVPVRTTAEAITLLAQEQLEVAAGGISPAFFNGISRGLKLRIVADKGHVGARGGVPFLMVRRDLAPVVKSMADLRGRRGAISAQGDLGHYLWTRTLSTFRLPRDSVSLVILPLSAYVAALQGGGVDAAFINPPLDRQASDAGIAFRFADPAQYLPGEPLAFLYFGATLLERNQALGVHFMTAYLRGLRRYDEGPTARNVAAVAEYTRVDPSLVRDGGWLGMRPDGIVDIVKLRRQQDWLFDLELISVRNPITSVVDHSFLEQAAAMLAARAGR